MEIKERAQEVVEEAFDNCAGLSPDKDEVVRYVGELVRNTPVLPQDIPSALLQAKYWYTPMEDTAGLTAPADLMVLAYHRAIEHETWDIIDQMMVRAVEQESDWKSVLNAADTLGIPATNWKYDDYAFLQGVGTKIWQHSQDVFRYADSINGPKEEGEAAYNNMVTSQPVALGLPISDDAADWFEFQQQLLGLADYAIYYSEEYGRDDPALRKLMVWEDVQTYAKRAARFKTCENNAEVTALHILDVERYLKVLTTYEDLLE